MHPCRRQQKKAKKREENTESNDIGQDTPESETKSADKSEETENRILIAYFSRTGENYSIGYIEKGNTQIIADMIAEQIGGDTFEISTVTPCPDGYQYSAAWDSKHKVTLESGKQRGCYLRCRRCRKGEGHFEWVSCSFSIALDSFLK